MMSWINYMKSIKTKVCNLLIYTLVYCFLFLISNFNYHNLSISIDIVRNRMEFLGNLYWHLVMHYWDYLCSFTKLFHWYVCMDWKFWIGLEILAFPCNQFREQEPETSDKIVEFVCTRFKSKFPIFGKVGLLTSLLWKFTWTTILLYLRLLPFPAYV